MTRIMGMGGATGDGRVPTRIRTIGPIALEKYLGRVVDKLYYSRFKHSTLGFYFYFIPDGACLETTVDGEFCLTGESFGNTRLVIKHGDALRIYNKSRQKRGKGFHDYIFIDDSD